MKRAIIGVAAITPSNLTYDDKRKCLNCSKPIADQEHAIRKYCEVYYDESGQVHDCKTDYHRANDKPERDMHSKLINDHKIYSNQIKEIIEKKGNNVTTDDLNAYNIALSNSLKFEIKNNGTLISYFLQYIISSNPVSNTHTITAHE